LKIVTQFKLRYKINLYRHKSIFISKNMGGDFNG